jgi:uncharacterized protein (DUF305 family)
MIASSRVPCGVRPVGPLWRRHGRGQASALRSAFRSAFGPALLSFLVLGGCATGSGDAEPLPASSRPGPDAAEADRLEALYWSQVESARNRFTEADVGFMVGMIGHHAQALAMAGLVPDRSRDPAIRTLARRIDNAQRGEIQLMEAWLRRRNQPVPHWHIEGSTLLFEPGEPVAHGGQAMPGAGGHGGHTLPPAMHDAVAHGDHAAMPGMLTPAQMAKLDAASGSDFDRLFLASMIQHHQGAVEMVRILFATDGAGQDTEVFRFASDVQVDQATEIARMERMLRERTPSLP